MTYETNEVSKSFKKLQLCFVCSRKFNKLNILSKKTQLSYVFVQFYGSQKKKKKKTDDVTYYHIEKMICQTNEVFKPFKNPNYVFLCLKKSNEINLLNRQNMIVVFWMVWKLHCAFLDEMLSSLGFFFNRQNIIDVFWTFWKLRWLVSHFPLINWANC